jgi:acetyl-CoA/propionyl-CoA carboxylase biotin carboxyl carrier protein
MFDSVLIANRGEVAVRIIRACKELGIRSIAIYSEVDQGALWTRLADEAHCIGAAASRESYLNIERLIQVARASGAGAVHPGYGLLSESAEFARAVSQAGLAFIGPSADVIALMGDKVTARQAAVNSGVPVLPGSPGPVAGPEEALAIAARIGWPIAVKASFGGGGRGLRVAHEEPAFAAALEQAGRESLAAFGRSEVFLERYLLQPRHVEVQVLGDTRGHIIHLGDRDCSVQRRHQKLLEEAPAPGLPEDLRRRILAAAVKLCRDVGYVSAGTVEFLVDVTSGAFYFLEMNTRLQVEHGVTELVSGIDIVKQQIRIAQGVPISLRQSDVVPRGHAIQARIAAEDPWDNFRPVPGRIHKLTVPMGPWLRLDFGFEAGDEISRYYDSMFGKIQAWGSDREEACQRLSVALSDFHVAGVPSTAPFLKSLLIQPTFVAARHDTGSLEREWLPDPRHRPEAASSEQIQQTSGARLSERFVIVPWNGRKVEIAIHRALSGSTEHSAGPGGRNRGEGRATADIATSLSGGITAPMDAMVVDITCTAGQLAVKGSSLLLLEAMKMEVALSAPADCRIETIHVRAGQSVRAGELLITTSPAGEGS